MIGTEFKQPQGQMIKTPKKLQKLVDKISFEKWSNWYHLRVLSSNICRPQVISSTTSADGFIHVDGKRKIDYILYREVDGVKTVNNSTFFSQFIFAYHVHVAYGKYWA